MRSRTLNILIGGEAGQGLVTVGQLLAKSLVRRGYFIVVTQSYQSRIRGGHNTFAWYKERCEPLPPAYDPTDWEAAMKVARQWGDKITTGVIYRNDRLPFEDHFPVLSQGPLVGRDVDRQMLKTIMQGYG